MKKGLKVLASLLTTLSLGSVAFAYQVPSIVASSVGGNTATNILGVVQWIGIIVGVVMIIWVGVKYLMAGAGEKAKAKETLIPMLIGAFLVMLAGPIMNAIINFTSSVSIS